MEKRFNARQMALSGLVGLLVACGVTAQQEACSPGLMELTEEEIWQAAPEEEGSSTLTAQAQTMSKSDLASALATQLNITPELAKAAVDGTLDLIVAGTKKGDVRLYGWGTFKVVKRAARTGVKPGTTTKIKIPAYKTMTFKISDTLKKQF
jgi:DNA-binding protein HU-beta